MNKDATYVEAEVYIRDCLEKGKTYTQIKNDTKTKYNVLSYLEISWLYQKVKRSLEEE